MREALKGLVNSRQFKALTKTVNEAGGESSLLSKDPRINLMNNVMSQYRLKAKHLVVREFPDLLETLKSVTEQQNELKRRTFEELNNPIPTL